MIEVKNLFKKYGQKIALNDVSFSIKNGEVVGFLGPNGAGKSTTMNIISGYLSSSNGTVSVDGFDVFFEPIKAKSKIGYLPEQPPLYLDMTVNSYLKFMANLKKIDVVDKKKHIDEICKTVKIIDMQNRLIKNLSKGYKQRVGIAQALLGNPPLLILDEPTVGLDPKQIIEIRKLIKDLSDKHTIILSSHILSEIQSSCDRIIVINNGKVIADDTTKNLSKNVDKSNRYIAQIYGDPQKIMDSIKTIDGVDKVKKISKQEDGSFEYNIFCKNLKEYDIRKDLFKKLTVIDAPLVKIDKVKLGLEDIFLKLTESNEKVEIKKNSHLGTQDDGGKN